MSWRLAFEYLPSIGTVVAVNVALTPTRLAAAMAAMTRRASISPSITPDLRHHKAGHGSLAKVVRVVTKTDFRGGRGAIPAVFDIRMWESDVRYSDQGSKIGATPSDS